MMVMNQRITEAELPGNLRQVSYRFDIPQTNLMMLQNDGQDSDPKTASYPVQNELQNIEENELMVIETKRGCSKKKLRPVRQMKITGSNTELGKVKIEPERWSNRTKNLQIVSISCSRNSCAKSSDVQFVSNRLEKHIKRQKKRDKDFKQTLGEIIDRVKTI